MKTLTTLLFGLCLTTALRAEEPPKEAPSTPEVEETLMMRSFDKRNRHRAGNAGASNDMSDSEVTLKLFKDGTLHLHDAGTTTHGVMSSDPYYTKTEERSWDLVWRGTWLRESDDTLELRLILDSEASSCVESETWNEEPPETQQCAPLPPSTTQVECTLESAALQGEPITTWRCDTRALLGTPGLWTLGRDRCIQRSGRKKTSYKACEP